MTKTHLTLLLVFGFSLFEGGSAVAQVHSEACAVTQNPIHGFSRVNPRPGCPLSATMEVDHTQTLADGTLIHTVHRDLVYRDSDGRVRYETYPPINSQQEAPQRPVLIQIIDPVAGFNCYLRPNVGVVSRSKLFEPPLFGARLAAAAQPSQASQSPPTPQLVPKIAVEELGSQEMQGVLALGKRTTHIVPPGLYGNDRPLTIVTEVWSSSDMGIILLEKTSDPRSGETEIRVIDLNQTEPDPAMFRVPADYTIQDR